MSQACPSISRRQSASHRQRCSNLCHTRTTIHTNQILEAVALLDPLLRRWFSLPFHILYIIQSTGTGCRTTTTSPCFLLPTLSCPTAHFTEELIRNSHTVQAIQNFMPSQSVSWGQRLLELHYLLPFHRVLFHPPVFEHPVRIRTRSRHRTQSHRLLLLCVSQYRNRLTARSVTRGNFLCQRIPRHPSLAVPSSAVGQLQVTSCPMMMNPRTIKTSTRHSQMDSRTLGPGFNNRLRGARRS